MNTHRDPRELVLALTKRADFKFQVACVIADKQGVFSWGWAHSLVNKYTSMHAEIHALSRANRERVKGAIMYVAATPRGQDRFVLAFPCDNCRLYLNNYQIRQVIFTTPSQTWKQWPFESSLK